MRTQTDNDIFPQATVGGPAANLPGASKSGSITAVSVDLDKIIHDLRSGKSLVRLKAREQIERLEVSMLLELMKRERRLYQREEISWSLAGVGGFLLSVVVGMWAGGGRLLFLGYDRGKAFADAHEYGAIALARTEDPAAVKELVTALKMRDAVIQYAVWTALIRVLPCLTTSDYPLLGQTERNTLRLFLDETLGGTRLLQREEPEDAIELVLAVLKALKQVGDASFLPIVTCWAKGEKRGSDPRVRDAAAACLPFLKQTIARRQQGHELVRASSGHNGSQAADVLLWPVEGPQATPSEELLRPSRSDEGKK